MQIFISIINQALYFGYQVMDLIFQAFGLSWIGFTVGLAVVSVILRLFAGNLIGTAMSIRRSRRDVASQDSQERRQTRNTTGRGASYSTRKGN